MLKRMLRPILKPILRPILNLIDNIGFWLMESRFGRLCNLVLIWTAKRLARTPEDMLLLELNERWIRQGYRDTGLETTIILATDPRTSEQLRISSIRTLMLAARRPIDQRHPKTRPLYHDAIGAFRQTAPLLDEIAKTSSSPAIRAKASKLAVLAAIRLRRLPTELAEAELRLADAERPNGTQREPRT